MELLNNRPDAGPVRAAKLWRPQRVLITRSARAWAHGREIARRAADLGCDVVELSSDRLMLPKSADERAAYRAAKSTLAVVVAPAGEAATAAHPAVGGLAL